MRGVVTQSCGVFVVRIWLESAGLGESAWRASVTDTFTKEKRYFAEPAALSGFLLGLNLPDESMPRLEPEA